MLVAKYKPLAVASIIFHFNLFIFISRFLFSLIFFLFRRSIIGDYETTSTHRLILPLTNENDSGNYSCLGTVQNSTGDSALFIVKVIGESVPKIRDNYPPAKLILYVSQVFQLACAVSNYHPVNYAWGKESGGIFHNMHVSILLLLVLNTGY